MRESIIPNAEGLVVGKRVGRWNIETEVKMMVNNTGMPRKEGFGGIVDGHVVLQLLDVLHVERVHETTEEQSLVDEAQIRRDRITSNNAMVRALGSPRRRETSIRINDEVRAKRVGLDVGPTGAKAEWLLAALTEQRRAARRIMEAIAARGLPGWVRRSMGNGTVWTTLPIILANVARAGERGKGGRAEARGDTRAKARGRRKNGRAKTRGNTGANGRGTSVEPDILRTETGQAM